MAKKWQKVSEEIERLQRQKEELQVNGLRQEILFKLEIERLQNKIDKAVEYINEEYDVEPKELYGLVSADELLKILKGE